MQRRVKVSKETLEMVQTDLKDKGFTLDEISDKIGSDFRNFRYKGHSMERETFQNLKDITEVRMEGSEIDYIDGAGESKGLEIEKSCSIAELFGIILGDGYVQNNTRNRKDRIVSGHRVVITLHSDEKRLREKSSKLLENITGKEPAVHSLRSSNAIQIFLNSKEAVKELKKLGLEAGDKVQNQVEVPDWIKTDSEYEKACLRGLVDTDGTIYRQSKDSRVVIQFKNHSNPLLKGFKQMCTDLDINVSSGGKHTVQVASQNEVQRFIQKVQPLKASNIDF